MLKVKGTVCKLLKKMDDTIIVYIFHLLNVGLYENGNCRHLDDVLNITEETGLLNCSLFSSILLILLDNHAYHWYPLMGTLQKWRLCLAMIFLYVYTKSSTNLILVFTWGNGNDINTSNWKIYRKSVFYMSEKCYATLIETFYQYRQFEIHIFKF